MLEYNRKLRRKVAFLKRVLALALPTVLIMLLLAQIAFAKNTYLIHDGGRVTVYTTYATDPAEVLDQAGLQLNAEDTYITQVSAGVSEITIQRKQQVRIVMGGKVLQASTYGETVGDLLHRLGIQLTQEDILSEKRSSLTYDGMTITISQGITRQEQNTVTVPYATEYCYDASIPEGQQVILTAGSDGQAKQIVSVSYADGKEISRTVLSQEILVQPINALIAIGTKQPELERPVYAPARPAPEAPQLPTIGDGVIVTPEDEF